MTVEAKPTVLVFVGHYRPGFKAGGILRSVENLVNHLHGEFQFMIVTRDRDLGDDAPYPGVSRHEWNSVGFARVYYLEPGAETLSCLRQIVRSTPHDLIYLNSFFEPLTVKVLCNRLLGLIGRHPVILAPRGEFAWASLRLKYAKKAVFMWIARLIRLYAPVTWHASSPFEADDITNVMGIRRDAIRVALDLPTIDRNATEDTTSPQHGQEREDLRVVFLSRISPEKNLDFALRVLGKTRSKVTFDIIGPIENAAHWDDCQKLRRELPTHVTSRSLGSVNPSEVMKTLAQYDLLLLPSGGENYGHVIAESLTVGTPVLISTNTPWRNLMAKGLGWDLALDDIASFVRVIDEMGTKDKNARLAQRKTVRESMRELMAGSSALESNRRLLNLALKSANGPGAQ